MAYNREYFILSLFLALFVYISDSMSENPTTALNYPKTFIGNSAIFIELFITGCLVFFLIIIIVLLTFCLCYYKRHLSNNMCQNCLHNFGGKSYVQSMGLPPYQLGDNKLALSAQRFHYELEKEKVIAYEKERQQSENLDSEITSDIGRSGGGHFKIYQYPGLEMIKMCEAMEVENPAFNCDCHTDHIFDDDDDDENDASLGDSTCHDIADDVFSDDYNDVIDKEVAQGEDAQTRLGP